MAEELSSSRPLGNYRLNLRLQRLLTLNKLIVWTKSNREFLLFDDRTVIGSGGQTPSHVTMSKNRA